MKYLKLAGLIVIAAIAGTAATAVIGTNSASPTALCSDKPVEGVCSSPYKEHKFSAGAGIFGLGVEFATAAGGVICTSGYNMEGETTEPATAQGKPLKGLITQLEFEGCSRELSEGCSVQSVNLPYLALFEWSSEAESLTFENGGSGAASVAIKCGAVIDCVYSFESPFDVLFGGFISANEVALGSAGGKTCPGSGAPAALLGTFQVSEGGPLYVADYAGTVTLCKKNENPCAEKYGPASLAGELSTAAEAKFKVKITEESKTTEYVVACKSSGFEGKTTASSGLPLPAELSSFKFGECGGTCAVSALGLSYKAQLTATTGGSGKMLLAAGSGGAPRIQVRCIGAYKCTYEWSSLSTAVTGGAPASLAVNATLTKLAAGESDAKCGSQAGWEGAYKFSKPETGGEAKMWIIGETL